MAERQHYSTNTPWEHAVGYSRAVRVGAHVVVSGTTASDEAGEVIGVGDVALQTRYILQKIEAALIAVGASLADVVRVRMFVTDIDQWQAIGEVHGEFFGAIRPVSTMVEVSRLVDARHLVEIEVDAIIAAAL
ncbi:MAG: RidA family protein [bacterium]|nr:RidA family protein [bacterium]